MADIVMQHISKEMMLSAAEQIDQLKATIEELDAQIAGFMRMEGATVKICVCEAAVERWNARRGAQTKR